MSECVAMQLLIMLLSLLLIAPAVPFEQSPVQPDKDVIDTGMSHSATRGALILGEKEELLIDHDVSYSSILLGEGSTLSIMGCTVTVVGSGAGYPTVEGRPDSFIMDNSTLVVRGLNGSGLIRDRGNDAVISLNISSAFEMINSKIRVTAGNGWEDISRGYYLKEDVAGYRFAGGNATFLISMKGGSFVLIGSGIQLVGGKGGDAPDAENLASDDIYMSGGYTVGGDVKDHAGSGGCTVIDLDCPGVDARAINSYLTASSGSAGNAGDAGGVIDLGDEELSYPVPPGGYTTSWIVNGTIAPLGEVRHGVGSGGDSDVSIRMRSLFTGYLRIDMSGGDGGNGGNGGSCRADVPEEWLIARTTGGGGGGGYAGAMGGGNYGSDGGDVTGRVGAGGNCSLDLSCEKWLQSDDLRLYIYAGSGGLPGKGGLGGGQNTPFNVYDGGGGGAGGFSGGAGCGELTSGLNRPGEPGFVGREVGRGGNVTVNISARYLMARGNLMESAVPGEVRSVPVINGMSGEVGGDASLIGGHGGIGSVSGQIDGELNRSWTLPGPVLLSPGKGAPVQDVSTPFRWEEGVDVFWSAGVEYEFRLLSSPDPSDIVMSGLTTMNEYQLQLDPGDGIYHWTVKCRQNGLNSSWSLPREVCIDRQAPRLVPGPDVLWLPASEPNGTLTVDDDISGPDPDTLLYRVDVVEGENGSWQAGGRVSPCGRYYNISLPLPAGEHDLLVWVRISDKAGNGPAVIGPLDMRTDGTPPFLDPISPRGWVSSPGAVVFDCADHRSGLSGRALLEFRDMEEGTSVPWNVSLPEPEGDRYRVLDLPYLKAGRWSYRVSSTDMVGNEISTDWIELNVDPHPPNLTQVFPANGTWTNVTEPLFSVLCFDDTGQLADLTVTVSSKEEVHEVSVSPDNISSPFSLGAPLSEGWYRWNVSCSDIAGNHAKAGPWWFGIDVTGPEVVDALFSSDRTLSWDISDEGSGLAGVHLQRLAPRVDGWSVLEERYHNDTACSISYPFDSDDEVVFWRVRGTDAVGNQGGWSDVVRGDVSPVGSIYPEDGVVQGRGEEASIIIECRTGVDMTSVSWRASGGNWSSNVSLEAVSTGEINLSEGIVGPLSARLKVDLPAGAASVEIEVRWLDMLPLADRPIVGSTTIIFDLEPPSLELHYERLVVVNEAVLKIHAVDEISSVPLGGITVASAGGKFGIDEVGGPMLLKAEKDNFTVLLNLTWGVLTTFTVEVKDEVNNVASETIRIKASRPPEPSIGGAPPGGEVKLGEKLVLRANIIDPDGERCTWTWLVDGKDLGNSTTLTLELPLGEHVIILRVDDGSHVNETAFTVTVLEPAPPDGSLSLPLLLALVGAMLLIMAVVAAVVVAARMRTGDDNVYVISKGSTSNEEPGATCSICMRGISDRSRKVECRCGSPFHRSCGMKEGECPDCGREIMISKEE